MATKCVCIWVSISLRPTEKKNENGKNVTEKKIRLNQPHYVCGKKTLLDTSVTVIYYLVMEFGRRSTEFTLLERKATTKIHSMFSILSTEEQQNRLFSRTFDTYAHSIAFIMETDDGCAIAFNGISFDLTGQMKANDENKTRNGQNR